MAHAVRRFFACFGSFAAKYERSAADSRTEAPKWGKIVNFQKRWKKSGNLYV